MTDCCSHPASISMSDSSGKAAAAVSTTVTVRLSWWPLSTARFQSDAISSPAVPQAPNWRHRANRLAAENQAATFPHPDDSVRVRLVHRRDLWAVGPSALPCAGAAPPQRPALSRHLAHSSPARCLANSIPLKRFCRGRPCACPVPLNQQPPGKARPDACPASLQLSVNNPGYYQHNLPAKRFPPKIWDAPAGLSWMKGACVDRAIRP